MIIFILFAQIMKKTKNFTKYYNKLKQMKEGYKMEKTIKEILLEMGMEENEIDNHCSDLYVKKNDISTSFVNEYEFKQNVTTFRDQIEGQIWYDIPFAYSEYYINR